MSNLIASVLSKLNKRESNILDEYIEKIANNKLLKYQNIVQTGAKEGQTLYQHVIDTIFTIAGIKDILNLSKEEEKLVYIALTVHDMNKLPSENKNKFVGYRHVATSENIESELEDLEIEAFFPEYKDFIEDIKLLILAHSVHSNHEGELMYVKKDCTKLGKLRLNKLKFLIKAADTADLSKTFYEKNKKHEFIGLMNQYTDVQYQLVSHKINEQRGLLTNVIHNNVIDFMKNQFNALPVFSYPEGTYYIVKQNQNINLSHQEKTKIALSCEANLNSLKFAKFDEYISSEIPGIKVAPEVFKLGAEISKIFNKIGELVIKKSKSFDSKRIDETEGKMRAKLTDKLKKDNKEIDKYNNLLAKTRLFPDNAEHIINGEFLKTMYLLLDSHYSEILQKENKLYKDVWNYIYKVLEYPIEKIDAFSVADDRTHKPFFVSPDLNLNIEELIELFKNNIEKLPYPEIKNDNIDDSSGNLTEYLINSVSFSFDEFSSVDFSKNLIMYVENNHSQCCNCNSLYKTNEFMSADVPSGMSVEVFSNRLEGGKKYNAKRNVCPVCKEQFSLEKLSFKNIDSKFIYLHLIPHSYMPPLLMESYRQLFENIDGDMGEIDLNSIMESIRNKDFRLALSKAKYSNGILVPKYSNLIGNSIILPLYFYKKNNTERYLLSVEYALLINKFFNFKVVLTESAIPILKKDEFDEIYFDGLPGVLRGLIKKENYNSESVIELWEKYLALKKISSELKDYSFYITLATKMLNGELGIFHEIDKAINRYSRNTKNKKIKDLEGLITKNIFSDVEKIII